MYWADLVEVVGAAGTFEQPQQASLALAGGRHAEADSRLAEPGLVHLEIVQREAHPHVPPSMPLGRTLAEWTVGTGLGFGPSHAPELTRSGSAEIGRSETFR